VSETNEPVPVIPPRVEETGRLRRREVSITNAYRTHYDSLDYYDRDAYDAWDPNRKEDPPIDLPWEITRDDLRQDVTWNEVQARQIHERLGEIITGWNKANHKN
jgi:hypothetical protein